MGRVIGIIIKRFVLVYLGLLWLTPNIMTQTWGKKFSYEIYDAMKNGQLRASSASYCMVDIGNYAAALQLNEVALEWGLDTLDTDMELDVIPPEDYFKNLDDQVSLVIVSEAHHKPQHRIFTRKILKTLYDKGFRYLGLEALTTNFNHPQFVLDSLLNDRRYPLDSPLTGRYAMEPMMGQLIRTALDLGFTVFGYDRFGGDIERDLGQAMNIKKMMDRDPEGKYLIHCGWYHAIESDYPKRKDDRYMAHHLKRLTGHDPLTVYQDLLSEKYLYRESPVYEKLQGEMGIVVNSRGEALKMVDHFDVLVYHPRTTFKYGRPSYLFSNPNMRMIKMSLTEYDLSYPVHIEATLIKEGQDATPMDRVEVLSPYQNTNLILPPGEYSIYIIDNTGKTMTTVKNID